MMQEALSSELRARFQALKNEFHRLDAKADAQIVRWRYAEESAFELQADYFRRFNERPGTLVEEEPVSAYMYNAYGYDAQGRVICAALFQQEELPRLYTFYTYGDGFIDLAEFGIEYYTDRYHLTKVGRLAQPVGQSPVRYAEFTSRTDGSGGFMIEEYQYDDLRRLARVTAAQIGEAVKLASSPFTEEDFEYEGEVLRRIVKRTRWAEEGDTESWSPDWTVYEAPREDETTEMLFNAARASLYSAVINRVIAFDPEARRQTRFYNLVLSYDAVSDDALLLIPGRETQREAWEKNTDEHDYGSLYVHALAQRPDTLEMIALPEDYQRFVRQRRRDREWDDIRRLMSTVARELNLYDWREILNTTDDFILFANDYETMEDVHDEIRACVPEDKLRLLRANGLLD
jgi:hypothetical protein